MNQKQKKDFLTELKNLNQDGKLVDYIKNGISTFYKIYDNKQKQAKTNNSK